MEVDIFSHAPHHTKQNSLTGSYNFFENLFYSSRESGGRGENYEGSAKLTIVSLNGLCK